MLRFTKHGMGIALLILLIPLLAYARTRMQATAQDVVITQLPVSVPPVDKTSKEYVKRIINQYSSEYGVDASLALRIANCESGFNPLAKNKNSSASGVFQFIHSTWMGTPEGKQGLSVFDSDANVEAAIKILSQGGVGNWAASKACWSRDGNNKS